MQIISANFHTRKKSNKIILGRQCVQPQRSNVAEITADLMTLNIKKTEIMTVESLIKDATNL